MPPSLGHDGGVQATQLISLASPAPPFDPALGAAGLPSRVKVLNWGANETSKGPVIVDELTLSHLPQLHRTQNWDQVALDFNHNTERTSPTYEGAAAKVAGYGAIEVVRGDGVYMNLSSWTADGRELAGGGHFKDLSATVLLSADKRVLGVSSVALCQRGAAKDILFLSSPWEPREAAPPQSAEELFEALRSALGLSSDATPAQVADALSTRLMTTEAPNPTESAKTAADQGETIAMLTASVDAMKPLVEQVRTLSTELADLRKQGEDRDREMVLSAALNEGKQVPDSAKSLTIEQLRTLCSELPVTVPMELRTPEGVVTLSSPAAPSAAMQVSRITGVSDEDRAKYAQA
jgi:phage I-like protein